jgi:hypothetical protein
MNTAEQVYVAKLLAEKQTVVTDRFWPSTARQLLIKS